MLPSMLPQRGRNRRFAGTFDPSCAHSGLSGHAKTAWLRQNEVCDLCPICEAVLGRCQARKSTGGARNLLRDSGGAGLGETAFGLKRETPGIGAMRTRLRGAPPRPTVLAVPQRWPSIWGPMQRLGHSVKVSQRRCSARAEPAPPACGEPASNSPRSTASSRAQLPGGISQYLPRRSCRRHASSPASNGLIGRPSQPAAAAANVSWDRLLSPGPRPAHPLTSLPLPVDRPPLRVSAERTDHPGLHLRTGAG